MKQPKCSLHLERGTLASVSVGSRFLWLQLPSISARFLVTVILSRGFLTTLLGCRDSCQCRTLRSEAALMHEPYWKAVNGSWVGASAPFWPFADVCWSCWLGLPILAVCFYLLAMPWPRRRHYSRLSLGVKSWNCILWAMLPSPSLFWKGSKPAMKQVFKAGNQSRHSESLHRAWQQLLTSIPKEGLH